MKKYFGTDGIRGKAFTFLNAGLAFRLGQAIAKKFKPKEIVIGEDTRQSSPMLSYGLAYGLATAGVDVKMTGIVSTPMIAYYSKIEKIIGVMITASHNPHEDNGIKIFKSGYKMLDDEELELESYLDAADILISSTFGSISISDEVVEVYKSVYEKFNMPQVGFKVAYDSAHGATFKIAKEVIERYAEDTYQMGASPDGLNINLNVGSMHLDAIKEFVKETKSDIGLSFDGDGDRILVVDGDGTLFDGDMIVYIIAKYLKSVGKLNQNTVVLTQMSNPGILKAFKDLGIQVVQTQVGDKYVSHEIVANNYTIGGENSGHIILNDLLPSGDGLFAAMYLLKTLSENKLSLKAYTKDVKMFPQKMTNIKNIDKMVLDNEKIKQALIESKSILGENSLLLVRPSGTEPVIRVTISHEDETVLDQEMTKLVSLIKELGAIK